MMQSIKEFYRSREIDGIPKHNTHDLANFEVKLSKLLKNQLSQVDLSI